MRCDAILLLLDPHVDGELGVAQEDAITIHLRGCASCAHEFRAARSLREKLSNLNHIAPPPGSFERLTAHATLIAEDERSGRRKVYAMAAAILIALSVPLIGSFDFFERTSSPVVTLSLHQPNSVHLVFNAAHRMEGAMVTVRLPPGIELQGYPGRHTLRWTTTLLAGKNKLTLPIVAVLEVPGRTRILASVSHDERSKEYAIPIDLIERETTLDPADQAGAS
jgi:hypothetical protein